MKKYIIDISIVIIALLGLLTVSFFWKDIKQQNEPEGNYKIGVIINFEPAQGPNVAGFKAQMEKLGYKEGQNTEYVYRITENIPEKFTSITEEIASANLDLIILGSGQVAMALKQKNLKTPMIIMDIDPTAFISNFKAPEANITGLRVGFLDFAAKRLEIMKEIDPTIKKIIVPTGKMHPNYASYMNELRIGASKLNIEIVEFPTKDLAYFMARYREIIQKKNGDAFIFFPGPNTQPFTPADRRKIVDQLVKEKISSITHNMEIGANEGILIGYGNHRADVGLEAAVLADKILTGTPIKELPVEPSIKTLHLEINLKTAKDIGITIPQDILARALKIYNE